MRPLDRRRVAAVVNVAIANAVYPPEPVVSAQIARDLAANLTSAGARVTVLCPFPTRPIGAEYSDHGEKAAPQVTREGGVAVVRLPSFAAPQSQLIPRLRESLSLGRHVCRYLDSHLADVDVVYANVWPLLGQAMIARYCARRGVPLVLHIQDIYPESLLERLPGFLRQLLAPPLLALDRWTVQNATRVVVISQNMRQTYVDDRAVAPARVIAVLNWVDEDRFAVLPPREEACAAYGVPEEKFTFLYLGNIGPVADVEGLIEAFHEAKIAEAQLVVAGDGSAKGACMELANRKRVSNVLFVSDPDVNNVPLIQSLAHVCLLPMRRGAGSSSIPSKLMAYLLSQKPVLATVDAESDTARCICDADCGWVGEPEDVPWLAAKMAEVAIMPPDALVSRGRRGQAYGLQHFSKAKGVRKLGAIVLEAAAGGPESGVMEGATEEA